ncbi:hypothetical protein SAMN06265222_101979 [Neorhodopirellula lusitana]|uniref:Uncharacterized protein n=1 Tax=Neorhodopirellula lusitana TaxID=445327 RepID=A0ABY1PRB7_9BACT|nr:hypothetical protein [Neorhodopirellula lusitana]SMP43726.1 hypothetical protein SAMN06265222_101979 [Neorhodopirellula lusitana]
MSATNRSKLIAKLQTALKKNYDVPPASPSRPLLEHALYACLLEDCTSELADEGLAKLEQDYFDWNEVRVTTVTELGTVLSSLPDAAKAAARLKGTLQGIFEEFYSFDLDHLKKENLGKAVARFEKIPGMTPFVLSYIIQHGLGGHSIPIDYSGMVIMLVTGIATQAEAADGRVPGLERAIPKSKGIEFATLLHQPAVALLTDPKDKAGRALLDSVVKGSSEGLDEWLVSKKAAKKRVARRRAEEREVAKLEAEAEAAAAPVAAAPTGKKKPIRSAAKATSTTNKPRASKKAAPAAKAAAPKAAEAKASAPKASEPTAEPEPAGKSATKKAAPKKTTTKKASKTDSDAKPEAKSGSKKTAKKTTEKDADDSKTASASEGGKKASNRKLTKRKPR